MMPANRRTPRFRCFYSFPSTIPFLRSMDARVQSLLLLHLPLFLHRSKSDRTFLNCKLACRMIKVLLFLPSILSKFGIPSNR